MSENITSSNIIENISSIPQLEEIVLNAFTISAIQTSPEKIDVLRNIFLGRKGLISELFSKLSDIATKVGVDKKEVGGALNKIKQQLEAQINENIVNKAMPNKATTFFDPTFDRYTHEVGKLHPISREKMLTEDLFMRMGFDVIEDRIVETDYNVFESLNLPPDHPARDLWDTFWTEEEHVLRVHTTAFQNHLLKDAKENDAFPIRAIQPGLCLRNEATDARHEHTFYQVDGLYVEKKSEKQISIIDLVSTLRTFFSLYFGKEMNIRIQPAYFPFVEPGFEFAISCIFCEGKGCNVCSKSGWLEIGGTGMVHPNVLKHAGLSSDEYSGFAFGYGLDRMAQLRLNINDIRLFRSHDLRFITNT